MNAISGAVALGGEPTESSVVAAAGSGLQVAVEAKLNLRQHVLFGALATIKVSLVRSLMIELIDDDCVA